jgi:hypothetical protein
MAVLFLPKLPVIQIEVQTNFEAPFRFVAYLT